ncbi:Prefoldin, partial [Coemansia reversa NRRL 1564]
MSDDTMQQVYLKVTQKIQESQKQLNQIDAQISSNQRDIRLASLTKRELDGVDNSVPLYKSMGKMFVQESKSNMLEDIDKETSNANSLIQALEKKKKFVSRSLEEATGNLKDIIR